MNNRDEHQKKLNIVITLFPPRDETLLSIKARFVELFLPLAKSISVIDGDLPELYGGQVRVIRLHGWAPGRSVLAKVITLLLVQAETCFALIRIIRSCDIVILASLGELEIMPLLITKIFRRKVVLVQGGTYASTFDAIYSRKWLGLGKIIPVIAGLLARVTHGLADGLVVDTKEEADFSGLNKYKGKIFVCGIAYMNTDIFKVTKNLEDRRNIVGYIGRFSQEKGIINLIKAIHLVLDKQADTRFLLCGDGPLLNEAKKELEVDKTSNKVTLAGRVPLERVPDYLNDMRLLVIPSYFEGLPKILMEAMACGTPVLVTPAGGMTHLIKQEKTGFILASNSPQDICEGIVKALHHPRLPEIAGAAHRLIVDRYTYEPVVKSWENALQELMKRRNKL